MIIRPFDILDLLPESTGHKSHATPAVRDPPGPSQRGKAMWRW